MDIVRSAVDVNQRQRARVVEKLQDHLKVLRGTTIGLLGLAFKGGTDDLRDAPALTLIELLASAARWSGPTTRSPCPTPARSTRTCPRRSRRVDELVRGCDAVVIVTDWDDYRHLDWAALAEEMRGTLVLDARNLLKPDVVAAAGLTYVGVGR
jgi:UDPglucose 6-dehydrogenase